MIQNSNTHNCIFTGYTPGSASCSANGLIGLSPLISVVLSATVWANPSIGRVPSAVPPSYARLFRPKSCHMQRNLPACLTPTAGKVQAQVGMKIVHALLVPSPV